MIAREVVMSSFTILFLYRMIDRISHIKLGCRKQMGNKNSKAHKSFSGAHKHSNAI